MKEKSILNKNLIKDLQEEERQKLQGITREKIALLNEMQIKEILKEGYPGVNGVNGYTEPTPNLDKLDGTDLDID
jgi:hypothetical protein